MARQQAALSILRGLGGFGGGRGGGLGNVSAMPSVGGMGGGGGLGRGGGQAPAVRSPGSSDLLVHPKSALAHGDDLLQGYLREWFPTPQQQQEKANAELFAEALLGKDNNQGLLGQTITPELLAQAAGTMRQGGADANGVFGLAQWAVPAIQQQQELEWKKQKADLEMKRLEALIRNTDAKTANTQAAGARAAAKAAGGGGASAGDYF